MQSIRQHGGGIFRRWFFASAVDYMGGTGGVSISTVWFRLNGRPAGKREAVGLRYTVMIGGKRHHLYYEDNFKWFVEAKTSV